MVRFCAKLLYQFSESIIHLTACLRIVRMEKDRNLKSFSFVSSKNPQKLYMVCSPFEKIIRFLSLDVQGAFLERERYFI